MLFFLGIFYALIHQLFFIHSLPVNQEVIPSVLVSGKVDSVVRQDVHKARFYFRLTEFDHQKNHSLLYLSWYKNAPQLFNGQQLVLKIKLKKARNYQNPGRFDFKAFLLAHHVEWTGYVKQDLSSVSNPIPSKHLRSFLARKIEAKMDDSGDAGLIKALALGLSNGLDASSWDLFKRTGTVHLMVISGAHVGLVALIFFHLFKWLWTCSARLCRRIPAQTAGAIGSLAAATAYAFLSGFGLPVQRALVFCFFFVLQYFGKRAYSSWQIWRYALLLVLLMEPHALLLPGFYLSFLAVAAILAVHQRWPGRGVSSVMKIQAACLIALSPLSLYWFSYSSLNGFLANLLAVPFVGMLLLPLAIIAVLLSVFQGFDLYYSWLSLLIHYFITFLKTVDHLQFINLSVHLAHLNLLLLLGCLFFLLYFLPFRPFSGVILLLTLLLFFPPVDKVPEGQVKIDVLDVGQGLSVAVRTAGHVLIYDTGDKFFQGSDMGKMVILPYLEQMGVRKIDRIVISHPDRDHQGGLRSIKQGIRTGQIFINDKRFLKQARSCHQESRWTWDGIDFRFFPIQKRFKEKNNRSCILQISNGVYRMLLTGDIEVRAEDYLVKRYAQALQSDILLVPHHGSKTSSSLSFLKAVQPKYAISSSGFDNRFHFPHAMILNRYRQLDIPFWTSEQNGMIRVVMGKRLTVNSIPTEHWNDISRFFHKSTIKACFYKKLPLS